ncbi:MAG: chorismate mutase [Firmicutes bacterium]|jgi:chorismate mutase|nr:chorismate mutase [Bacillota bacterium]
MSGVRGIRGAITVQENSEEQILAATETLLREILRANDLSPEDIASIIFTVTDDLNAAFPAKAARQLGLLQPALLCAREIPVPGALPRCIRMLLHVNTPRTQKEIRHIYLGEAGSLRPDLD